MFEKFGLEQIAEFRASVWLVSTHTPQFYATSEFVLDGKKGFRYDPNVLFPANDEKQAMAIVNARNEELHTGGAAFDHYPTEKWLSGFYRCCKLLSESMGYDLVSLFGAEEATIVDEVLKEAEAEVLSAVKKLIAVHQQVFSGLTPVEKGDLLSASEAECDRLSHLRHHRVTCPSCGGPAASHRPMRSERIAFPRFLQLRAPCGRSGQREISGRYWTRTNDPHDVNVVL